MGPGRWHGGHGMEPNERGQVEHTGGPCVCIQGGAVWGMGAEVGGTGMKARAWGDGGGGGLL